MRIFYFCIAVLMLFLAITAGAKLLDDIKADSTPVKVRVVECYREVAKYLCDLQRTETVITTVSLERYEWNLFKAVEGGYAEYTFSRSSNSRAVDVFLTLVTGILAIAFGCACFIKSEDLEGDFG